MMEAVRKGVPLKTSSALTDALETNGVKVLNTNQMDESPFLNDKKSVFYTELVLPSKGSAVRSVCFGVFHDNTDAGFVKSFRSQVREQWDGRSYGDFTWFYQSHYGVNTESRYNRIRDTFFRIETAMEKVLSNKKERPKRLTRKSVERAGAERS